MIENFEKLVADYLREADVRVRVTTPDDTNTGWVRLTLLNAPQEDLADHFSGYYCQFDCYAGVDNGQPEVFELGGSVRTALRMIAAADHELGVVTGSRIEGYSRVPDAEMKPARERVIITATIWAHPHPS